MFIRLRRAIQNLKNKAVWNVGCWHKGLVVGLYGSFRYGTSFEHRQTGLAPCGYGNGDGKVTLGELQTYLDDEMIYQARQRYNRDQKVSVQGKLDSVSAMAPAVVGVVWHSSGTVGTVNS